MSEKLVPQKYSGKVKQHKHLSEKLVQKYSGKVKQHKHLSEKLVPQKNSGKKETQHKQLSSKLVPQALSGKLKHNTNTCQTDWFNTRTQLQ